MTTWFPWWLTLIGAILLWAYGNKYRFAPLLGILVQANLALYAVATKQYGFLASALIYAIVHVRNQREWS